MLKILIFLGISLIACLLFLRSKEKFLIQKQQNIKSKFPVHCPTINELRQPPDKCTPKYPRNYDSDFFVVHKNFSPGPSEQTNGLRHVLMAAIILQKGLITSSFTIHKSDILSTASSIPFGLRIDMEIMCQYVSLMSPRQKLRQLGSDSKLNNNQNRTLYLSDLLILQGNTKQTNFAEHESKIISFLKNINQPPVKFMKKIKDGLVVLPPYQFNHFSTKDKQNLTFWFDQHQLLSKPQSIIGIFQVYNWIFGDIFHLIDEGGVYRFKNPVKGPSKPPNLSFLSAKNLYKMDKNLIYDAYLATQHPKFLRDLAKIFIRKKFQTDNFVAVHFRYNPGDFFSQNFLKREGKVTAIRGITYKMALKIQKSLTNSTYFLENLMAKIEKLKGNSTENQNTDEQKPQIIYIASPDGISKYFPHKGYKFKNYKIYTTKDMHKFLNKFMNSCWVVKKYFGDILSTLEKELMILAEIFFRSRPSNWSFNEQGHRASQYEYDRIKNDRVIFDVFSR